MRFENVNFPEHVAFKCRGCGCCCREQPADVTDKERRRIEKLGFTHFLDEKDLSEPRLIKTGEGGGCFFLSKNGACLVQEAKPAICSLVPFMVVDWDYEANLIEVDLPADCVCPGVGDGEQLPVETLARAAQAFVCDLLEAVAKEECLPVTDRKVLSKTRLRILQLAADEQR